MNNTPLNKTNDLSTENVLQKPKTSPSIWKYLEKICRFTAFATIVVLGVQIISEWGMGVQCCWWFKATMIILLAAAVGYLTNWIAIMMLFQPYEKTRTHWLTIITFGLWQQGLIPSKKDDIAKELGKQIESKLLNPEKIADEFCSLATELIDNGTVIDKLQEGVQTLLREHEPQIVDFIYPQVEGSLTDFLDNFLTEERFVSFFKEKIEPWLRREDVRRYLADALVQFGRKRSDVIITAIKQQGRQLIYDYLSKNPLTLLAAGSISDGIIGFINWERIEWKLYDQMNQERTQQLIRDEILNGLNHFREQLGTPKMREQIASFIAAMKPELKTNLSNYLRDSLPRLAKTMVESESLWTWAKTDLVPQLKPRLENWIRQNGKSMVIDKLNISQRVTDAVKQQNFQEFHQMIDGLAAEHLGAIQVLGYVLGAAIGAFQLFVR